MKRCFEETTKKSVVERILFGSGLDFTERVLNRGVTGRQEKLETRSVCDGEFVVGYGALVSTS